MLEEKINSSKKRKNISSPSDTSSSRTSSNLDSDSSEERTASENSGDDFMHDMQTLARRNKKTAIDFSDQHNESNPDNSDETNEGTTNDNSSANETTDGTISIDSVDEKKEIDVNFAIEDLTQFCMHQEKYNNLYNYVEHRDNDKLDDLYPSHVNTKKKRENYLRKSKDMYIRSNQLSKPPRFFEFSIF